VVSISYVEFTALILIFRQSMGGQITTLDAFIIRTLIQLGLLAVIGSLLPPLLAQFDIQPTAIWQVSSGIIAVILGIWVASFPSRRRAASPIAIPSAIWVVLAFLGVMDLTLLSNVVGPRDKFGVGIYSLGVTGVLLAGIILFLFSLIFIFGPRPVDHFDDTHQPGKGCRRARRQSR
jgi:hypothetical protein